MLPLGNFTRPDAFSHEAWSNDQDPSAIESIEKPLDVGEEDDGLAAPHVIPKSSGLTIFEPRESIKLVLREL